VIEWVPTLRVPMAKLAFPPLSVAVPKVVVPFLNVTVPVGVPEVAGLTVAVKVTDWPKLDGLSDETTVVVVVAAFVTSDTAGEVLASKSTDPP
jgi:hypothetical protein